MSGIAACIRDIGVNSSVEVSKMVGDDMSVTQKRPSVLQTRSIRLRMQSVMNVSTVVTSSKVRRVAIIVTGEGRCAYQCWKAETVFWLKKDVHRKRNETKRFSQSRHYGT